MLIELIKDKNQRERYRRLSPTEQEQVMQIIKRHLRACAKQGAPAELEATFREAIELVIHKQWEPDRKWERPEVRWHYDVYTAPSKEAA